MLHLAQDTKYRDDIDGLRAISVLAVIFFHFGYLANGFLGVDVFFVISGFLITGIIYKEMKEGHFSIINFYLRRTRRIIPLALFIAMVALAIGIPVMLPDDLENLAQSVIATNFFGNNILQAITTRNYWDVVNEFKPLMHTWSLGVEEQYYLFYPFLFLLIGRKKLSWLLPAIAIIAAISLVLYLMPQYQDYQKFYYIFFRFWELAAGGIAAIVLRHKLVVHKFSAVLALILTAIMCFDIPLLSRQASLVIVVILTVGILASANAKDRLASLILKNKLMVGVGKISYSMYMWHQLLLAYTRYFITQELRPAHLAAIFALTCVLSTITYYLVEKPFRDKKRIGVRTLLVTVSAALVISSAVSFYIYSRGGVLKDIPELDISRSDVTKNIHIRYNARIYDYDRDFVSSDKIKTLVIGNSFARDWVNVLLESRYADGIEISYIFDPEDPKVRSRSQQADVVFYSTPPAHNDRQIGIPPEKLWVVGPKNFGISNGVFYNYRGSDYYLQRTAIEKKYADENNLMKQDWSPRYIDLIAKVVDARQTVPVFTPTRKFISRDCRHFTQAGAKYYAGLYDSDLRDIFANVKK